MRRYAKQLKELKDKGYFMMADGTKSSDHEDPAKKKKAKSETKPGKKRSSAVSDKKAKSAKPAPAKAGKASKKDSEGSEDGDLDIESEEASAIEASD